MPLNPFKRQDAAATASPTTKRAGARVASAANSKAGVVNKNGRGSGLQEALARKAFKKWNVRRNLYRRLAVRVRNGAAIEDVLDMEAKALAQDGNKGAFVLREASRLMRNGHSLADALKRWIPPDEMGILATSEGGDSLSDSLEYFIETRRRMHRVMTAYRNAFVQPVIYLLTVYGVMWSIAKYSVPDLASSGAAARATGLAKLLLTSSELVNNWQGMIPPVLFLTLSYVVARSFSRWTGPLRVVAERWFPYSYYRDAEGFTWLSGHVSLLQVGLSDVDIFARQLKYASPWLRERLSHYRRAMVNGKSLAQALATPMGAGKPAFRFPNPDIINDIAAMGDSTGFPEKIRKVLDSWAEEMEEQTLEKSKVFGFSLEICMYVIMGFLMLAMNSLINQVSAVH
jgi:type II secretory pathway component PulF